MPPELPPGRGPGAFPWATEPRRLLPAPWTPPRALDLFLTLTGRSDLIRLDLPGWPSWPVGWRVRLTPRRRRTWLRLPPDPDRRRAPGRPHAVGRLRGWDWAPRTTGGLELDRLDLPGWPSWPVGRRFRWRPRRRRAWLRLPPDPDRRRARGLLVRPPAGLALPRCRAERVGEVGRPLVLAPAGSPKKRGEVWPREPRFGSIWPGGPLCRHGLRW